MTSDALRFPAKFPLWLRAASVLLVLAAGLPAVAQRRAADAESGLANGLIVRLRAAPSHEQLKARSSAATAEGLRWQRVLSASGLAGTAGVVARRAVGADQQLLQFSHRLGSAEVQRLVAALQAQPEVEWVEPNQRERLLQTTPNDPLFAGLEGQWWLQPVSGSNGNVLNARLRGVPGFQTAWARSTGSAATVVAVLDSGITFHPDLAGRVLPGHDFVRDIVYANDGDGIDDDPTDPGDWVSASDRSADPARFADCEVASSSWHGTIVAGMAMAATDNNEGGAGINWAGKVLPVRVAGKCGADVADIIDGMRWAAGLAVSGVPSNPNPARVINISFGGTAACGAAYQSAIDELKAIGVVVVAAAGNEHAAAPTRPASCSGAVGVVSLNRDGFKTSYSNFGGALAASGIATVGGDDNDTSAAWSSVLADSGLTSLTNTGSTGYGNASYARHFGTSFSTPLVSGAISLMLSLNPALTHAQILEGLRLSARPHVTSPTIGSCSAANPGRCICSTGSCGVGILDADRALLYAANPAVVMPTLTAAVVDNADVNSARTLATQDRGASSGGGGDSGGGGSSGGGGALGATWLALLGAAVLALRRSAGIKG